MKEYFKTNGITNDYDIVFSYCKPVPEDGKEIIEDYSKPIFSDTTFKIDEDYPRNFNCTLRELKQSNFDMMILDNSFLFSDDSSVKSIYLNGKYLMRRVTDYYEDFNDYDIREEDIKHHESVLLDNGHFKNYHYKNKKFYGLPYERDFNLLFYHDKFDDAINDIFESNKINNTEYLNSDGILSIGLKDNDEILNSFVEYVAFKYGIPKENDNDSFGIFYNEKLQELFKAFRNVIIKYAGENINQTLDTSTEQAYFSFINNEKMLFKGKASSYKRLINNPNISVIPHSLPNNFSSVIEKFLIINIYSKKKKEDLVKIALQLTSPDMQLYRAEKFGTIPTFDLKNDTNDYSQKYCQGNFVICHIYKAIKPIYVNKFFKKGINSANFMETRLVVPMALKDGLINNNDTVLKNTFLNILDLEAIPLSDINVPIIVCNVINIFYIVFLLFVIFKVYKYRKHPYLKAISPFLSSLTIIGIILHLSFIYVFGMSSMDKTLCRLSYVIKVLALNLIYLPMISIIFRIYYIYTNLSQVNYGKKVNDKRLIKYVFVILMIAISVCGIIAFNDDFYIGTFGTYLPLRFNLCVYNNMNLYFLFATIYSIFMFIGMIVMTVKTIKVSRKYGEIRFIVFIVLLLFSSIVYEISFIFLATFDFKNIIFFIIAHALYLLSSLYCAYLLVGARLLYIRKNPIKNGSFEGNSVYNDYFNAPVNLVDFIPLKKELKKEREGNGSVFRRRTKHSKNNQNSYQDISYYSENINKSNTVNNGYNQINNNSYTVNNSNYYYNNLYNYNNNNNNNNNNNSNTNNKTIHEYSGNNKSFESKKSYNNSSNINKSSDNSNPNDTMKDSNSNNSKYNNEYINNYINNYINDYTDYLTNYNNQNINNPNNEYFDSIENNPNNYFFNQSLKLLSQEDEATKNDYYIKKNYR
ncbi:hypothetical protein BCR36DRAFT_349040 [Piromyces finnis]|uniref:G-protein coupled receptors family 3 profile domain-containing protein n=1 Tax=Piromyces finnis TaxID=1754191 RepID=A0A1Y1VD72_9FUNG|nr:hypothetical protein BCR36DRAFT_349040 [Piromyces finnis]|eukprot:ORX53282.1 hypothetical protein BCR36DRAFT_349040 [Piromyces finnis]